MFHPPFLFFFFSFSFLFLFFFFLFRVFFCVCVLFRPKWRLQFCPSTVATFLLFFLFFLFYQSYHLTLCYRVFKVVFFSLFRFFLTSQCWRVTHPTMLKSIAFFYTEPPPQASLPSFYLVLAVPFRVEDRETLTTAQQTVLSNSSGMWS